VCHPSHFVQWVAHPYTSIKPLTGGLGSVTPKAQSILTTTSPAGLIAWAAPSTAARFNARDFASLPITGKNLIEVGP
jgi:hypothetical protein